MVLALAQVAAALPWGLALTWDALRAWYRQAPRQRLAALVGGLVAAVLAGGVLLGVAISVVRERESVEVMGRVYAVVFQLQLTADFFVLIFLGLTRAWPKGGAVARAAFRESYRQPMFWLFVGASVGWLALTPFLPYFTFGEDYIMVKEIGYDTIMLAAVAFGVIAASMSISEEIEGRTAVTLMSKPVSRRQFLLGKFFGILLACLVMVAVLGLFFDLVLLYKYWFDKLPPRRLPPDVAAWVDRLGGPLEARHFLRGTVIWVFHAGEILPGQVMSSSLVMVLVAVAVALATRLPMIVNLVTCLVIYFLANLMPVLVKTTQPAPGSTPGPVQKLIYFMAQLFDALLPGLDLFRVRPTLVDENALSIDEYLQHVGVVTVYGILFTTIVLLLGLVLFEDRDLA
ncbi:MAG: ABC transporter permease subunit [Planctomycetes bacterium]|nr:ABC transporter permease subunit [Planctomycetota bacterium]